jgi:prepilin-type N-terminal cleavage/methylation domain-containing protein
MFRSKRDRKPAKAIKGFTLMELAVVLMLSGIIATMVGPIFTFYTESKDAQATEQRVSTISKKLENFVSVNSRYPCPASLSLTRNENNYGHETNCEDTTLLPGQCANGICIEESQRTLRFVTYASFDETRYKDVEAENPGVIYNEKTKSFYKYVDVKLNWDNARAAANAAILTLDGNPLALNGHLVTITSQAENDFVNDLIIPDPIPPDLSEEAWTSATDDGTGAFYLWNEGVGQEVGLHIWQGDDTGSAINDAFTNWVAGDPDDDFDTAIKIEKPGATWSDDERIDTNEYIIEWDTGVEITFQPRIRVGMIPFRQLNIMEDEAYDSYGNRIMYAVTEYLTNTERFLESQQGGISIVNEQRTSVLTPAASSRFVIISHGKNGKGAYGKRGVVRNCPAATDMEWENTSCPNGAFFPNDGTFMISERIDSEEDAQHFDDIITFFDRYEESLWQLSADNVRDIHQKNLFGKVGVFVNEATTLQETGQVGGTVRATDNPNTVVEEGILYADKICKQDGSNCFSPALIAGRVAAPDNIECPAGQFMKKIENGQEVCVSSIRTDCPAGGMAGIEADGKYNCANPPGVCPSVTVTVCPGTPVAQDFVLPEEVADVNNVRSQVFGPVGNSRHERFSCIDHDGTTPDVWKSVGGWDLCECTPLETRTTSITCPDGSSGTKEEERTRQCDPTLANHGSYSSWQTLATNCTCDDTKTETKTNSCPTGSTGTGITFRRDVTCPAGWGSWYEISRDCTCTAGQTQVKNVDCPTGTSGVHEQTRTIICPDSTWTQWKTTKYTCQSQVCVWRPQDSGIDSMFSQGAREGSTCTCGEVGSCYSGSAGSFLNHNSCRCE